MIQGTRLKSIFQISKYHEPSRNNTGRKPSADLPSWKKKGLDWAVKASHLKDMFGLPS